MTDQPERNSQFPRFATYPILRFEVCMIRLFQICVPACLAVLAALPNVEASAGVVITVQNAQLSPMGNGIVDVLIRGDANETLSNFGFAFRIDPLGGATTQLRFASLQNDLQLGDANYVFAAGSLKRDGDPALSITPEPVGTVFTDILPNDSFIGTDSYTLIAPSSITLTNSDRLLARLELTPGPGLLAPVVGDQFSISLVDGPLTSFLDESLADLPYSFTAGIVRVTAVPEPSTFLTAIFGIAFGLRLRLRARVH
jgi:hypothetical protein